MSPRAIVVTGSLNMDFVVRTEHLPAVGETVLGRDFRMIPGGKGANQACAAGKLSRTGLVRMVGRTGFDIFADQLKASLAAANVDVSAVAGVRSHPTGVALIEVDDAGQNSIVVASGANFAFPASDLEGSRAAYRGAACALFQLETPLPTVEAAMRISRSEGAMNILDPAPAQPLTGEMLGLTDLLTPNEAEACMLLRRPVARVAAGDAPELAAGLLRLGVSAVVLKLGDQGCLYADANKQLLVPAFLVKAVDSTAAGDVFNAALAVALAEGQELQRALTFANAAAGLSVTRMGAQASVPLRDEVDGFLAELSAG